MTDGSIAQHRPRDTRDADAAMERLQNRGFTAFRNGRIVIPDGHVVTDADRTDFDVVKGVYGHSKLV